MSDDRSPFHRSLPAEAFDYGPNGGPWWQPTASVAPPRRSGGGPPGSIDAGIDPVDRDRETHATGRPIRDERGRCRV